jgi:hypothetical protein
MKKNQKELLKKHHFWILFGLVPLFVLIGVLVVNASVGDEIEAKLSEITKEENAIKTKLNPKPDVLLNKMGELISSVNGKQSDLWKNSYQPQVSLYTIDPRLVPARFKLTDQVLQTLKGEGLADGALKKLEAIKNKEFYRGEFQTELTKALSADEREKSLGTILSSAEISGWIKDKVIPVDKPGGGLVPINAVGLKFGDRFPNDEDQYEKFKEDELYKARYERMARKVAPTVFPGTWEKILRFANFSNVKLTSDQIWLLTEDIWVQDSLLDAVSALNAQMAEFTRVKFERDGRVIDNPDAPEAQQNKLRRKFKSRTWEIELEVAKVAAEGGTVRQELRGRLINTTDKLQLLGNRNTMVLKVWLQAGDRKTIQPFEYRIGSEFVPGGGDGATRTLKDAKGGELVVPNNALEILPVAEHVIPQGTVVEEIAGVEQVFDTRTVPVRAIEAMALNVSDSRNAEVPLKPPAFIKEDPVAAADASKGGKSGPGAPTPGPGPGPGLPGGGPGGQSATRTIVGTGPVAAVADGNKKRYVQITEQVRRMPVAVVVVVDQAFMQDVLLAFANSPLRFQITQVTWNRYRGTLGSVDTGSPGGPGGDDNVVVSGGVGSISSEFGNQGGVKPSPGGRGPGPGPGPRPPGPTMGHTGPGGGSFGFGQNSAGSSSVSESQLTSGLIELSVYGIVSLYTTPEDAAADKKDGQAKDPAPKDIPAKTPNTPNTTDPKAPK